MKPNMVVQTRFFILAFIIITACLPVTSTAQEVVTPVDLPDSLAVAPPTSILVEDYKYDNGQQLDITWIPSLDDQIVGDRVVGYEVYRLEDGGSPVLIAQLPPASNRYSDRSVTYDNTYSYYIVAKGAAMEAQSVMSQPIQPEREWINLDRIYLFIIMLIIAAAVIFFVETAKRGKQLFIRKIAGLEAIDDAVGRATEMGRPVLFIPGIHDMDDVQTLAALTILGRVSRTIADYDSKIFMPVSRSLVMTAARETIKSSYLAAGRPDAYTDDMVNYVTDEQFGYVAAVDGLMVREKPATIFLLGAFFAESLILAETGNSVGAIQIAGTARPAQLPFFIAACDFTLIGEELFAASAYLSGEPKQLGSLKGQDVGKFIAMVFIIAGTIAGTFAIAWNTPVFNSLYQWFSTVFGTN